LYLHPLTTTTTTDTTTTDTHTISFTITKQPVSFNINNTTFSHLQLTNVNNKIFIQKIHIFQIKLKKKGNSEK